MREIEGLRKWQVDVMGKEMLAALGNV
jgi:hypothetical protein